MKKKRWILGLVLFVLILVMGVMFTPYFSYDPRLEAVAYQLRPIIVKLEDYKGEHGSYPSSLRDIGIDDGKRGNDLPRIGYFAETGSNGKDEMDFASSDVSKKIIGYEVYIDKWDGGFFYIHTDLEQGWFFNFGHHRMKLKL